MNTRQKNLRKAKKWAQICQKLPGVAAVYLSGSLATQTDNQKSDIDFFIIAHHRQIFTARFFINALLKIYGQLAKPHFHARKICPNHFVSENFLELSEKNKYSAHMFAHNNPLSDPTNTWKKFQEANDWIKNFDEQWIVPASKKNNTNNKKVNRFEKFLEKKLKQIQVWKIKRNKNFCTAEKIILTDHELRFHPVLKSKK